MKLNRRNPERTAENFSVTSAVSCSKSNVVFGVVFDVMYLGSRPRHAGHAGVTYYLLLKLA
jgi:hypothetical protein